MTLNLFQLLENTMETTITLDSSLTARNDAVARRIQETLHKKKILCVNLLGAPGCGKTTLIEGIAPFLDGVFVLQGDLKSDIDTERLAKARIDAYQIHTHSGCHLNAAMIEEALTKISLEGVSYLLIENVGNLVCPAGVLLGQDLNVLCNATTEGNDKPEKYPLIFKDSQAIVLTKYDLKDAVEFDEEEYQKRISKFLDNAQFFRASKKDRASLQRIAAFLKEKREALFN